MTLVPCSTSVHDHLTVCLHWEGGLDDVHNTVKIRKLALVGIIRVTSIRKTLVRIPTGLQCVFSSDPAASSSIFVREKGETDFVEWSLFLTRHEGHRVGQGDDCCVQVGGCARTVMSPRNLDNTYPKKPESEALSERILCRKVKSNVLQRQWGRCSWLATYSYTRKSTARKARAPRMFSVNASTLVRLEDSRTCRSRWPLLFLRNHEHAQQGGWLHAGPLGLPTQRQSCPQNLVTTYMYLNTAFSFQESLPRVSWLETYGPQRPKSDKWPRWTIFEVEWLSTSVVKLTVAKNSNVSLSLACDVWISVGRLGEAYFNVGG